MLPAIAIAVQHIKQGHADLSGLSPAKPERPLIADYTPANGKNCCANKARHRKE